MREAERQREEALAFARRIQDENKSLNFRKNILNTTMLVLKKEQRITSGLQAAATKLAAAREAGDLAAEVEAKKRIARLGYEEKQAELKTKQKMEEKKWQS